MQKHFTTVLTSCPVLFLIFQLFTIENVIKFCFSAELRRNLPVLSGFRIENALPDGLTVRADRMLLTNVVRNLWENAMKYSDPGVCVTVRLTADGRHVRLSVADTGWGIRRSELRRVFALYYRSSHHGRKVKGFGIGLAKSRLSMKAMGGRLTVESREGEGSTFTVTLRRR